MPTENSNWTDKRLDLLKDWWAKGKSAAQIAIELGDGATRSAVIGKIHRLGLQKRAGATRLYNPKPKRAKRPRELVVEEHRQRTTLMRHQDDAPPPPPKPFKDIVDTRPAHVVALIDMGRHDCRWPFGDPRQPDFGFCGAPAQDGSSYCPVHHRRAYVPRAATT